MKIVIDAGHGYNTPGKRAPGDVMREYHFNRTVALQVMAEFRNYEGNHEIHFVHRDDRDVPLAERVKNANNLKADLYVSIHANAHGDGKSFTSAKGIETFVYKKSLQQAVKLAEVVQRELVAIRGQVNRGVKEGNLQVLRETNMTAILIECGFMTNQEDLAHLMNEEYRVLVGNAIVRSIATVYGIKHKSELQAKVVAPKPQAKPVEKSSTATQGSVYRVQTGAFSSKENADKLAKELSDKGYKAIIVTSKL